jgi:hypothetical protein
MMAPAQLFALWCRKLRGNYPRSYFAPLYGLNERAVQDLEQGRSLPSRALVVLLKAIELDPLFIREVAREARPELAALDEVRPWPQLTQARTGTALRFNRNKIGENTECFRASAKHPSREIRR